MPTAAHRLDLNPVCPLSIPVSIKSSPQQILPSTSTHIFINHPRSQFINSSNEHYQIKAAYESIIALKTSFPQARPILTQHMSTYSESSLFGFDPQDYDPADPQYSRVLAGDILYYRILKANLNGYLPWNPKRVSPEAQLAFEAHYADKAEDYFFSTGDNVTQLLIELLKSPSKEFCQSLERYLLLYLDFLANYEQSKEDGDSGELMFARFTNASFKAFDAFGC